MVKLLRGDCIKLMPTLPASSVNLILADLPYGTTLNSWDKILPVEVMWREYTRLLAPGGVVVLFGSQPFSSALVMSNPSWFKYELIWSKNKCGSPGLAKYRPMKTHENILVFARKGRSTYNPQMEYGKPYARSNPEGYKGRCNNHKYGFKASTGFTNSGVRYPKSVREVSRDFSAQQQVHPTQKPVPLLEWLVLTYSNKGDVVLDNCVGSGSTGVACCRTDRSFIGIEKDREYFTIARGRIRAAMP